MDHVAIMRPSWRLIPKILSGEKSIESRWYQTRRAPWNKLSVGDRVFFKDSGAPIVAKASVTRVWQFEINSLSDAETIVKQFGSRIALVNPDVSTWGKLPRFCVLIQLINPITTAPFQIDKRGFGSGAAWITCKDIECIRI